MGKVMITFLQVVLLHVCNRRF